MLRQERKRSPPNAPKRPLERPEYLCFRSLRQQVELSATAQRRIADLVQEQHRDLQVPRRRPQQRYSGSGHC